MAASNLMLVSKLKLKDIKLLVSAPLCPNTVIVADSG